MLAKILSMAFFVVLYHQEVLCLYFSHSVCLILINTFFFFMCLWFSCTYVYIPLYGGTYVKMYVCECLCPFVHMCVGA